MPSVLAAFLWTALAVMAAATGATAAERLTRDGVRLEPVIVDPRDGEVTREISLGTDVPTSTHVFAEFPDGPVLMRDRLGYWRPWDRNPDSLLDNGFAPVGGTITFKVFKQDLSDRNFPIRVTVAYETAGARKFGFFDIFTVAAASN